MYDQQSLIQHYDQIAPERSRWFHRNLLYHRQIIEACKPFIESNSRVLEVGCSTGDLLNHLNPPTAVGIDISPVSIDLARLQYPRYDWICADAANLPTSKPLNAPFDLIILADLVNHLPDVQSTLVNLRRLTHNQTHVVVSLWNWIWQPILHLGEQLKLKAPDLAVRSNWLSANSIVNLLELSGYEVVQKIPGLLLPYYLPVFSDLVNSLSRTPPFHRLALVQTVVARPCETTAAASHSVSVIVPTRNEVGNIEALVKRTPEMGVHTEIIFIDGDSTDGTVEKIHEMIGQYPKRDIKFMPQTQSQNSNTPSNRMLKLGKGDAIRKAFDAASGEVLMILDSDISVPPEELPKFYDVLASGHARFANGTRFSYPQEESAMPPINRLGNVFFSLTFSWLLNQPLTDTLCGTKVLFKSDYEQIKANRAYFGDFDPFGDFDLLFGAAWLRLRILEVPIRYQARTYGESKVRVHVHGPLLGRMSLIAFWQFKIRPLFDGGTARPRVSNQDRYQ